MDQSPVDSIVAAYIHATLENLNWSDAVYSRNHNKPGEYDIAYIPDHLLKSIQKECTLFYKAAHSILEEIEWKGDRQGFYAKIGRALWFYRIEGLTFTIPFYRCSDRWGWMPWETGKNLDRIADTLPKGRYLYQDTAGQINSRTP